MNNEKKKLIILIIISIFFSILFFFVFKKIDPFNKENISNITYVKEVEITPFVCLKQNNFLKNDCSSDNKSYVTSLIDYINLNVKYKINSSSNVDYKYTYEVSAKVISNEKGETEKIVYEKTDLLDKISLNKTNLNIINIEKTIKLDFQKYNNLIIDFKKNYILDLDSNIIITFKVNLEGVSNTKDFNYYDEEILTLTIPLTKQTVNINRDNISNDDVITKYLKEKFTLNKENIILIILSILELFLIILIMITSIKIIPKKTRYTKTLTRIIKEYDKMIVNVKDMPDLSKLKIIEVFSFQELLNAAEGLDKPILFYENFNKDESKFLILNDKISYLYILKSYGVYNEE